MPKSHIPEDKPSRPGMTDAEDLFMELMDFVSDVHEYVSKLEKRAKQEGKPGIARVAKELNTLYNEHFATQEVHHG